MRETAADIGSALSILVTFISGLTVVLSIGELGADFTAGFLILGLMGLAVGLTGILICKRCRTRHLS